MNASFSAVSRGNRTKYFNMCAIFLNDFRPARNTDQGVETCVQVSRESASSGTRGDGGELWFACEGTGVSTGGRAHSSPLFFLQYGPRSPTRVTSFFF